MHMSWSPRFAYILCGGAAAIIAAVFAAVLYVQISTLAAERDGAARGLADERGRASRLQADLGQLRQDYDVQKIAHGELVRSKEAVEQDRDGWKSRGEKAGREHVAVEGELKTVQAKLSETEMSLKRTREALEAAEQEKGGLRNRAEKAEREKSEADGREAGARALLAERDRELAAARTDISNRDEEIRKLQTR
jgi:chromosome segregation ATPase